MALSDETMAAIYAEAYEAFWMKRLNTNAASDRFTGGPVAGLQAVARAVTADCVAWVEQRDPYMAALIRTSYEVTK